MDGETQKDDGRGDEKDRKTGAEGGDDARARDLALDEDGDLEVIRRYVYFLYTFFKSHKQL